MNRQLYVVFIITTIAVLLLPTVMLAQNPHIVGKVRSRDNGLPGGYVFFSDGSIAGQFIINERPALMYLLTPHTGGITCTADDEIQVWIQGTAFQQPDGTINPVVLGEFAMRITNNSRSTADSFFDIWFEIEVDGNVTTFTYDSVSMVITPIDPC